MAKYAYSGAPNMVKWGVPEKILQMWLRRVVLRSIGPSSQKLWPNPIFGWFPHCNYNVKLQMGGPGSFMGLKVWNLACSPFLPKGTRIQKIEVEIPPPKKIFGSASCTMHIVHERHKIDWWSTERCMSKQWAKEVTQGKMVTQDGHLAADNVTHSQRLITSLRPWVSNAVSIRQALFPILGTAQLFCIQRWNWFPCRRCFKRKSKAKNQGGWPCPVIRVVMR